MKKFKLYLDTSVWNFVYASDAPEKQEITKIFFDNISNYEIFISSIVLDEISQAPEDKQKKLEKLIIDNHPVILDLNAEIKRLANVYVRKKIIPSKSQDDAIHIACCTYYNIDILLSWNYKHLANVLKKRLINIANLEEGYNKSLDIITPLEVSNED